MKSSVSLVEWMSSDRIGAFSSHNNHFMSVSVILFTLPPGGWRCEVGGILLGCRQKWVCCSLIPQWHAREGLYTGFSTLVSVLAADTYVSEWVSESDTYVWDLFVFSWWALGHVHSKNLRRSKEVICKVKGHFRCIPFCGMLGSCCHVWIVRLMSNTGSQSCASAVCFAVSGTPFAERSVSTPKLPLVFSCRPRRHGGEKKKKGKEIALTGVFLSALLIL